jgi:hypothetical protein
MVVSEGRDGVSGELALLIDGDDAVDTWHQPIFHTTVLAASTPVPPRRMAANETGSDFPRCGPSLYSKLAGIWA